MLPVGRSQACSEARSCASTEQFAASGRVEEKSMLTEHFICYSADKRGLEGIDVSDHALKRELEVNEEVDAASLREEPAVMVQVALTPWLSLTSLQC